METFEVFPTGRTKDQKEPFSIHHYLKIGLSRKWYIIIPLVLCVLGSFGVYDYLPKIYRATTTIMVQPQSVPENYVRPTITESSAFRLNMISQEILSRTRLEKVIEELNLYPALRKEVPMEGVVETMRKAVAVKVQEERRDRTQSFFAISFEGEDPETVMTVANKLASMFIEENLKTRELKVEDASDFISKELLDLEDRLKGTENQIRLFKEKNMGRLPQQLDANLRILEQLQQQFRMTGEKTKAAEDRMIILEDQLAQMKKEDRRKVSFPEQKETESQNLATGPRATQPSPLESELADLRSKYDEARTRYKENHPDVIYLRNRIDYLESRLKGISKPPQSGKEVVVERVLPPPVPPRPDPEREKLYARLKEQYDSAVAESKRLKMEEGNLQKEIALLRQRIEETPKREQELALLTRDYDLLKSSYQSLLEKDLQAKMAENLERRQKGERFSILDPARLPEEPIRPNRNKILLVGAFLGLALGFGLALFREVSDRSLRTVSVVEDYLGIPVLASLPKLEKGKMNTEPPIRIFEKKPLINKRVEGPAGRSAGRGTVARGLLLESARPVFIAEPQTFPAEEFRKLKAHIFLRTPRPRAILVTSTAPGEGKTLVAVNLALAMSQEIHIKTILVDGDLRKPGIHVEKYPNSKGLTHYLLNQTPLSDILLNSGPENLQILTAGDSTLKSAELIGTRKMSELLMSLRKSGDNPYVIIDSPPILSASDPILLSSLVDGIILVVMGNRAPGNSVQRAIRSIDRQKIIGIVFNQIDVKPSSYYYSERYRSSKI